MEVLMSYSVITVCLNSERTIQRTIDSVLEQTPLPVQYIFVDGGSTDGTMSIIDASIKDAKQHGCQIAFLKMEQRASKGITNAWNMGLRKVETEIVSILNSDDWYEPDTAGIVSDFFQKDIHTEIFVGAGKYHRFKPGHQMKICYNRPLWTIRVAMPIIHPACFVRTSVYRRLGYFEERYAITADYEFIFRCLKAGVPIMSTTKVLVNAEMGGAAENNRQIARLEMAEISERMGGGKWLPHAAAFLRKLLDR